MLPIAALHAGDDIGVALLWTTLLLDSANNGLLGVALLCFSVARWGRWPRALTWLGLAAGAARAWRCSSRR